MESSQTDLVETEAGPLEHIVRPLSRRLRF